MVFAAYNEPSSCMHSSKKIKSARDPIARFSTDPAYLRFESCIDPARIPYKTLHKAVIDCVVYYDLCP
ncbi:hypothetical protein SAY86_026423 [Trapa natans]|uniref:Uncharacterized protein n=1 Tax=Trapa natans TaxID=22666 RepID=A0AAN7QF12_TRANT|nr:hypothetical protein SAY86_026423 [Trapa natans]